jgi:hypothetical protein
VYGPIYNNGIAIACPHCHTLISAAIDPNSLKADIAAEVVAQVMQSLRGER